MRLLGESGPGMNRCLRGAAVAAVVAFPSPGWDFASPRTAITFSGDSPGRVQVTGSVSGVHTGRLHDLQGRRGSVFTPDRRFTPGEQVTVSTDVGIVGAGGRSFSFRTAHFAHPPFLGADL